MLILPALRLDFTCCFEEKNRCNLRLRSSDETPGELQPLADTERHQLFRGGGAELLRVLRSQAEPNINTIQL